MKILHLSTLPYGGAGVACMRLHQALLDIGVDSKVLTVADSPSTIEGHFSLQSTVHDFDKLLRRYKRKQITDGILIRFNGKTRELFSFPDSVFRPEDHPLVQEADVIHLHWVAGMIDVARFFSEVKKPIVWTLHDAWPFSGGFHYDQYWDTRKFSSISDRNLEVKKRAYAGRKFSIISPSNYLLDLGRNSEVFQNSSFNHIPYSIPSKEFSPSVMREATRKKYNVPPDQFLCVYASDELDYYRKGADLLLDAFTSWSHPNARLMIAGKRGKLKIPDDSRIQLIDRITDQTEMAQFLGAADTLIHTSREDNLPNLILEALFCGTPVLATPAGGVQEMITAFQNGMLTHDFTPASIREGLDKIAAMPTNRAQISRTAQEKYANAIQAAQVADIYRKL